MRLYSLQPPEALKVLARGEAYRTDTRLSQDVGVLGPDLRTNRAYRWLAWHLARQEPPPVPDLLPVWAWHTFDPGHPGLDLRRARPDEPGVLLELEIAPERVLLSDFQMWHAVLNDHFLGSEHDTLAFEAECEARGVPDRAWWPVPDLARRVALSWERCFDLDWWDAAFWRQRRHEKEIQAVLWEIRPADVVAWRSYRGWPRGGSECSTSSTSL